MMKRSVSRRKRVANEHLIVGGYQDNAKLSKPPKVHEKPRNRLQKRVAPMDALLTPYLARLGFTAPSTNLFVLEFEEYPYNTLPSKFVGVYSTVDSVTTGAIEHGAYTFSREGLLDGSEYLSATGRIRIHTRSVQQSGAEVAISTRSHSFDGTPARQTEIVRSDIPHPSSRFHTLREVSRPTETVYLAVRQGPTAAHCLGAFARPSLAWGACLKNKASCALEGVLSEESRTVDAEGMPRATARLHGRGQHAWFVDAKEVD
ncbi:hypothetical protein C7974DRAFT_326557, partial [Boeremia exigua]|uniref:uncharacterized protein n=1 Tax=Boeremia exigua TaxID=749465 RepID=UPI001E8EC837